MKLHLTEQYIKLILNGFTLADGEIYVSESFLIFLGVLSTRSLVSKSKSSKNGSWIQHIENNHLYILLNSIPIATRDKLNLNFSQDYLKELLITTKGYDDKKIMNQVKAESFLMIQKEISNYRHYLPTFYEIYDTQDERVTQAINLGILKVVVAFIKRYPRGLIGHFYDILKDEKIAKHSIPIESINYFYKYVKRIIRVGLPYGLIHGKTDKPSNNLKMSDTLKHLIIYLKSYGNFTSCREIHNNIKVLRQNPEIGEEIREVSESTIRNFLATSEANNSTLLTREGYRKFEDKILGYLPVNRTKDPLTKILIDGYVIQVVSEGEDSKPENLVMFSIMDTFSGFVIAEIGDVEDYLLIRRAFQKFLNFTGYKMPKEIISDAHTSIQSKYFKKFWMYLEDNGVHWEASKNPKRKGQLERWFSTLQQVYLTRIAGYIGEGIKSKRKDALPSEEIQFIIRKREFLKGKNEIVRLMLSAVDDYNSNAYLRNSASPKDLYHLKTPRHFIQLQDYHIPYFFWDKHEVSIKGSMIIISDTINEVKKKWFYRRMDYDFAKLNSEKVDAYHSIEDDKLLYIFNRNSTAFITTVEKQFKANEAIMDQTENDKKIIADFGISKARLHEEFVHRLDNIQKELENKFKRKGEELRLQANFKKQADDYIGYQAGLVAKTKEPDISKPHLIRKGRQSVNKTQDKNIQKRAFRITDTFGE